MLIVQEYLTRVAFYGLVAGPWLATNTQRKSVRKNNNPRIFLYTLLLFLSFFLLYYFTFVLNLFYMVLGGEGGPCEHHYYGSTNRGPLVVTRFWIGAHITSHHC